MHQSARRINQANARSKKLADAGRLAVQPPGRDDREDDAEWAGIPKDQIEKSPLDDFELYPENLSAWELYQKCSTQWRTGFNGITGLDYPAIYGHPSYMRLSLEEQEDTLWRIGCIEQGVLDQLQKLRDK